MAVKGIFSGPMLKTPPADRPGREKEKEKKEREHPTINTSIDPTVNPEDIRPTSLPSKTRLISEKDTDAPEAPGTFTLFRNVTTGDDPALPGAAPPVDFSPYEPSVGVNGRVVFYTTNNYAAVSGDRGQTFSYINPFDNFPADNVNDVLNGGFGGDQYVYYVRTHGLMCWLIQYNPDNTTNTYRLAVARSQADVLNNTWLVYDFTPATFGLPTPAGATGVWLDFPDLSASDNFLYFTANYFPRRTTNNGPPTCTIACPGGACPAGCTSCTGCGSLGAIVARIPLAQLAQGTGLSVNFLNDTGHSSLRLTQGARETMYWGAHNSNTQIAIYRWPESTTTITPTNVNHAAYTLNSPVRGSYVATCAGGTNYLSNDDDRIQAAWVANGVIGFMWGVAQGGGFSQPHVEVVRFNETNNALISQGQIFNNTHSYAYPSVHPNARGHLGGTISFGCGGNSGSPGVAAWIADDFNNNTITPLENVGAVVGNSSQGRWGDYFATRIYSPFANTWVGTGFSLNAPAPPATQNPRDHRFVWFGRERDMPSATNVIFVSLFNNSGYEDGTLFHPYNTIREGHFASMPGDTISIAAGDYHEPQTLNRASTLQRNGSTGIVTVGP